MNTSFFTPACLIALLNFSTPLGWGQEIVPAPSPSAIIMASPVAASSPSSTTLAASPSPGMAISASQVPASSYRNYSQVHVDGPYIAMSFDDGPSPMLTPRLLDILKERGIKVTFFVIGENAARSPELVARAAAEGHEIGNHTWDHSSLTKISEVRVQEELNKTSDIIFKATGKKPVLLRPPYGAINPRLSRLIEQQDGMKVILWSVDPNDWKRPGSTVVSQRILAGAKPGAIILSHDIQPGTIEAMPATLDALLAKGYHFVTISELIAMESKNPTPATTVPVAKTTVKKKKNK